RRRAPAAAPPTRASSPRWARTASSSARSTPASTRSTSTSRSPTSKHCRASTSPWSNACSPDVWERRKPRSGPLQQPPRRGVQRADPLGLEPRLLGQDVAPFQQVHGPALAEQRAHLRGVHAEGRALLLFLRVLQV